MHLGVTGSRHGITWEQRKALEELIEELKPEFLHHGDCVGADERAHSIASDAHVSTHVHPSDNASYRAFCDGTIVAEPKAYRDRNVDIVTACDLLVVLPRQYFEEQHSGTWMTYRIAMRRGRPVKVIWPDGTTEDAQPSDRTGV